MNLYYTAVFVIAMIAGNIAPTRTPLQCVDATGRTFIGQCNTLWNVLNDGEKRVLQEDNDLYAMRWFEMAEKHWVVCNAPASWAEMPGVDPHWAVSEIQKAGEV